MDGGLSLGAISSAFNATIRISQVVYELKAVGEQTRDLLDTTNHISTSLQAVKTLRRQKSGHLDANEKRWIDDVVKNTEKTLGNVATLVEPARADMQTNFGKVGLVNRGLFVLRDSPKVGTNLGRLGIASQSLNTAMNILCTREARPGPGRFHLIESRGNERNDAKLPTYDESEFLNRRRRSRVPKISVTTRPSSAKMDLVEEKPAKAFDGQNLDDGLILVEPVITVAEVTPLEPPKCNPSNGSDGLQVCDRWESQDRPWQAQHANQQWQNQQWQEQNWQHSHWENQGQIRQLQDLEHIQQSLNQQWQTQQWPIRPPFDTNARSNSAPLDPLMRCESRSSASSVGAPSNERQEPKSKGRARGRAWLEFQSER